MKSNLVSHSMVETHKVRKIQFGILDPQEIVRMSVARIENESIYDAQGMPNV